MAEDVAEVVALVRRAPVQVGAPRLQHRLLGLVAFARTLRLDEAELDVVDRELAPGLSVELFQELGRARRATGFAAQRETVAAARDRHVERDLDLAQVLVERAAQVGEALVVRGRERQLDGLRLQGGSGGRGRHRTLGCHCCGGAWSTADRPAQAVPSRTLDDDVDEPADQSPRPGEVDHAVVVGAPGELVRSFLRAAPSTSTRCIVPTMRFVDGARLRVELGLQARAAARA